MERGIGDASNFEVDRSEWPKVAIIILNWNNFEATSDCLKSLENIEYPNYQVIVVDNGSTDGSRERLVKEFEWPRIILNGENLGFSAGNNVGIKEALSDGADYVVLLNNDTNVQNTFLTPLVRAAESEKDIVISGGIIREMGSDDIWYSGGEFCQPLVRAVNDKSEPEDDIIETDHVTGALMCISAKYLKEYGLLDESYFFSFEDTEICYRARQNDFRVVVVTDSVIFHDAGATSGSKNAFRFYHNTINRLIFSKNNMPLRTKGVFYVYLVASRLIQGFLWYFGDGINGRIHATVLGILDYIRGRSPRKPHEFPLWEREEKTEI